MAAARAPAARPATGPSASPPPGPASATAAAAAPAAGQQQQQQGDFLANAAVNLSALREAARAEFKALLESRKARACDRRRRRCCCFYCRNCCCGGDCCLPADLVFGLLARVL